LSQSPDIAAPPATPWGLVILLGALTAFAPMSIDMYLPALPEIGRSLAATPEATQLTPGDLPVRHGSPTAHREAETAKAHRG